MSPLKWWRGDRDDELQRSTQEMHRAQIGRAVSEARMIDSARRDDSMAERLIRLAEEVVVIAHEGKRDEGTVA